MATKQGGSQPIATAPTSAIYATSSIPKNPVVTLSSKASKAEASHSVGPANSAVSGQVNSVAPVASSPSHTSAPVAVHNNVAAGGPAIAPSPKPVPSPTTTSAPEVVDLPESTIDVSYTTVGHEVHEQVDVMVEVTVTETAHVAKRTGHAHHPRHAHHKHHARSIGGRRWR